jgi:hypothetical protein
MQYNIYFRRDNWERFKDEENKSKLINTLLEDYYKNNQEDYFSKTPHTPLQETIEEKPITQNILEPDLNLKRACCLRPSPCVHWNWNGIEENYVNILTGEIRDLGEVKDR